MVFPVGILVWIHSDIDVLYQGYNQPFEALRDHEGGGHHLLVIQSFLGIQLE